MCVVGMMVLGGYPGAPRGGLIGLAVCGWYAGCFSLIFGTGRIKSNYRTLLVLTAMGAVGGAILGAVSRVVLN